MKLVKFLKYYFYFISYWLKIQYEIKFISDLHKHDLFALMAHHSVRQTYDGRPYYYHVKSVAMTTLEFSILKGKELELAYIGALYHDLIEDCHQFTYNDVKKKHGVDIADIVYACTELRGKNRKERHGDEYIKTLKESKIGSYVKLCDIYSNMKNAKETGHSMLKAYKKEYPKTKKIFYSDEFKEIFDAFEILMH